MSSTQVSTEQQRATSIPAATTVDLKLEAIPIPVSDVDRAKAFYGGLGWTLDADFMVGKDFRAVQLTPPGSPCSIHLKHNGRAGLCSGNVPRRVRHRGRTQRADRPRRRCE